MLDRTYISFLKGLHAIGFKSALIAGGAIRDDFFKKDFKDLDVFLWHPIDSNETILLEGENHEDIGEDTIIKIINYFDPNEDSYSISTNQPRNNKKGSYRYGSGIADLWNVYNHLAQKQIQLIFTEDKPVDYVAEHFDIGLCMCYFDGIKMHYSKEFMRDFTNKTLTICGNLSKKEFVYSLENHLTRLKHKFPNYTVQVPKNLEKFLTPELRQLL